MPLCDPPLVIKCPCPHEIPLGSFEGKWKGGSKSQEQKNFRHHLWMTPCQSSKVNIVAGRKSTSIRRFTVVE